MSRCADAVTSSTARLKAASLAREGRVVPLSFRTNWSADARISSSVAGGSKFASVLMLRHMVGLPFVDARSRYGAPSGSSNCVVGGKRLNHGGHGGHGESPSAAPRLRVRLEFRKSVKHDGHEGSTTGTKDSLESSPSCPSCNLRVRRVSRFCCSVSLVCVRRGSLE